MVLSPLPFSFLSAQEQDSKTASQAFNRSSENVGIAENISSNKVSNVLEYLQRKVQRSSMRTAFPDDRWNSANAPTTRMVQWGDGGMQ